MDRLFGTYLIFFIGNQIIFFGMKLNGSAFNSPLWSLISSVHSFLTYGTLALIGGAFLMLVVIPSLLTKHETTKTETAFSTTELLEQRRLKEQEEHIKSEENRKKQIEEQQKLEEQRKQEAIKKRRERSANAAAHDALDDFL